MSNDAIVAIALMRDLFGILFVICIWLTYSTWKPVAYAPGTAAELMLSFSCLMSEEGINMERKEFEEKIVTLPLVINGVLFTLTVVLLQNLLGAGSLDMWQTISLILFVIALPCLAGYAFVIYAIYAAKVDPQAKGKMFLLLQYIGLATDFFGIEANITNSSRIAGIIFLVASAVALVICTTTLNHIVEIHTTVYLQNEPPQKQK